MDNQLNFRTHIGLCVKKANSMLGIVKRAFYNMGPKIFVDLFKSIVRPHLEYASPVWSPSTREEIVLLEGVQRRGTSKLRGLRGLKYQDRLKKIGLPTLEYRRLRADLIQVYRLFEGIDDLDIQTIFSLDTGERTRHHPRKIYKGRWKYVLKRDSFQCRVITQWNQLEYDTVMAPSLNAFKGRLNIEFRSHPLKFCPSFMH